jgi:hypothetical protein
MVYPFVNLNDNDYHLQLDEFQVVFLLIKQVGH